MAEITELKVGEVYVVDTGVEIDIVSLPTSERVVWGRDFDNVLHVARPSTLIRILNEVEAVLKE